MDNAAGARASLIERPGGVIARIVGPIDEHFDGAPAARALTGFLVFDLDGVRRITSSGVRKWLEMLKTMEAPAYCYVNCRPAMVSQFNLVRQFGGRGQIVTLYAPFVCEQCNEEIDLLLDVRRRHDQLLDVAKAGVTCPACGNNARFDDYAEDYFECVTSVPPPTLAPAIAAIIDGTESHVKISKDVRDDLTVLWLSGTIDGVTQFKRVVDGLEGQVLIVLRDVTGATQQGFHAFRTLTESPESDVALARVPLTFAVGLQAANSFGRAHIVSGILTLECHSCKRSFPQEIDRDGIEIFAQKPPVRLCTCGEPLDAPREQIEAAASLPWATPTEAVTQYLERHFEPHETGLKSIGQLDTSPALSSIAPSSRDTRYEVLDFVAEGGMGVVYRGRLAGAGGFERRVAIKRIHRHLFEHADFVAMFLDEARIAARIHHPNVVSMLDVEYGAQGLFLVMEYIEGCSAERIISSAIARKTPLPPGIAVRIILDMLAGLQAAHDQTDENGALLHIVHRDVSPQNLLVGLDGIARLTDFGVARAERRLARTTRPGELKGKLSYLSPEQLADNPADFRSDVYSAGVVAWELLAGRWLFGDGLGRGALVGALQGPRASPRESNPLVPEELSATVMRALERDPATRVQSAAAFGEALEKACESAGMVVEPARAVGEHVRQVLLASIRPSVR